MMSDVERERETLAEAIHGHLGYGRHWEQVSGVERRYYFAAAASVLAALPGLGWVRRKDAMTERSDSVRRSYDMASSYSHERRPMWLSIITIDLDW